MPNQDNKYIDLAGRIFLTMIGFFVSLALLLLLLRFLLGLLTYIPWITYAYMLGILILPASLFISVFLVFARRTKRHPSKPVRVISWILFFLGMIAWACCLFSDLYLFFTKGHTEIAYYDSFNLLFLSSTIGMIFLVGIIQALTTEKEKDWMERPH